MVNNISLCIIFYQSIVRFPKTFFVCSKHGSTPMCHVQCLTYNYTKLILNFDLFQNSFTILKADTIFKTFSKREKEKENKKVDILGYHKCDLSEILQIILNSHSIVYLFSLTCLRRS
jgi:hypothetical protein